MKIWQNILGCAALLAFTASVKAEDVGRFAWALPWDDATATITSVANLNPTPAGGNGFVTARNGHFYDEKGRRVRFIGVNIAAGGCFPDKTTAEKVAARLHKLGVNIVRLHHADADWAQPNIFDRSFPDKQHLSQESLAKLDYFVYQLKLNGVYVNINLHVAREFGKADGFVETEGLGNFDKAVDFFEPRMIELQKNYARDLLTHQNPFTKTRYVEEPSVAVVEINNENTLLGEAWNNKLNTLPPHYKTELMGLWNGWLKRKYADTPGLKRAWGAQDKPFGPNILQNPIFEEGAIHWNVEMNTPPAEAKLTLPNDAEPPSGVKGRVARLTITKLGTQNWHLQFHQAGIDLVEGEPYTVSFWARSDKPRVLPVYASVNQDDYHHVGLDEYINLTPEWKRYELNFVASRAVKNKNRLTLVLGDALGTIDLAEMRLNAGAIHAFPEGVSLEAGNIPLSRPRSTPEGQDWIGFLIDTERAYMTTMRDYVKNELGAKANVTGSQDSYGGMGGALRESTSDFADNHAYWEHPNFPGQAWDMKNWNIANTPMTRSTTLGTLPELARYRIAGKPYTVSEYHHPAPNDYRVETLPMLAAFAAVQDWDGFYLFDYHSENGNWDRNQINGFFDTDTDPAITTFLPAAAMLFARFDVPFAHRELRLHIGQNDVASAMAKNGAGIAASWQIAGVENWDCLDTRWSVAFDANSSLPHKTKAGEHDAGEFTNADRPGSAIRWTDQGTDKALFRADSPSSRVIAGFVGGQEVRVGSWEVQAKSAGRNFAALTLNAIDGKPLEKSHSMLLTALAGVENKGMGWNAARTSVSDQWGTGPTQAEGVAATILIGTEATRATVYALDATGKRVREVESTLQSGTLRFAIDPKYQTGWYEVRAL